MSAKGETTHAPGHGHAHAHPHPKQPDVEDRPFSEHQVMAEAVIELLIEKGLFTADAFRRTLERIDEITPAQGSRVVARAWVDPAYRKRLLADVHAAAGELGIDAGPIPIRAVENTPALHNVIVCTLCSCYPRLLLGLPPDWYKSRAYRSHIVRKPREVLATFGTPIATDVEVRVHDSTSELRYFVVPMRPPGTEGWSEDKLASIVTRDTMIGVAVPKVA